MSDVFGNHELGIPYLPIADLLAKYRDRDADKVAIIDLDQESSITFGTLDRVVTDLGAFLKSLGVAKGSRILLLSDECLEKLLVWLAAWRIGAIICPLNIEVNERQLAELAAIVRPDLVTYHKDIDCDALIGATVAPRLRFGSATSPDPLDQCFSAVRRGVDPAELPERNNAVDLSCIFCTSGTTDRPKLVVYDHAAYWLNGLSTLEFLGLTAEDRTLEYRSFGWNSAQVLSLMPFLQVGPTLHIARRFSHSRFFQWVRQHGITFAAGVPTVVNMLLNKPIGYTAKDIPTLRLMSCSSAPLSPEQWERFEATYGIKLLQFYGMSEAGWVCGNRHYTRKIGTVGLAALHQEVEIVDADGRSCAPGVEGQISAGGPQTAVGYLLDDGSIEPIRGKRIRTGDLGVQDADGFIRVTGGTKDLIIRGGVNIAPQEIDQILLRHPSVAEAAAVGIPDPIYGEEVICFVVGRDRGLTEAGVIAHCRKYVPEAKAPKQVVIVAELPKNDRGKVLRDELRRSWTGPLRRSA